MPLAALSTPTLLAAALGVDEPQVSTQNDLRNRWITALSDASAELRRIIGQPITAGTATIDVDIDARGRGVIPLNPVRSVSDVTDTGGAVLTAGSDFHLRGQEIFALRTLPRTPLGVVMVTVTVEHGWEEVPADIVRLVHALAAAQIGATGRGNFGMTGGLTQVQVDDGRATFTDAPIQLDERLERSLRAMYGGILA